MTLKAEDENLDMDDGEMTEQPDSEEEFEIFDQPENVQETENREESESSEQSEVMDQDESPEQPDEETESSNEHVTYDGDKPLVQELQYQVPRGGKIIPDADEVGETKFTTVAEARAVVEGFLFSCNEPLNVQKLSKLLGNLHPKTVRGLLLELQWEYENRPGALQVVEIAGGFQLCTRAFVAPWMFRLHKHKRRSALSPATLETLAIIAYRQPITKGEIEGIRGVESGAPVRTLQDLNLVEASGRREVVGRPQLYVTTEQFLKTFGLKSVGDLPSIAELKSRFAEEQKLKHTVAKEVKEEPEQEPVEPEGASEDVVVDSGGESVGEDRVADGAEAESTEEGFSEDPDDAESDEVVDEQEESEVSNDGEIEEDFDEEADDGKNVAGK